MGGRHRLEAADQLGMRAHDVPEASVFCSDPYSWAISLNLLRRHLTQEQRADIIVTVLAAKSAALSRQDGEPIEKRKRGGQVDKIKAAAVATGKHHGIGKRTTERSLAKIGGRPKKKRKPKTYPVPADVAALPDDHVQQMCMPCGTPIEGMTMTGAQLKEQFRTGAPQSPQQSKRAEGSTVIRRLEAHDYSQDSIAEMV